MNEKERNDNIMLNATAALNTAVNREVRELVEDWFIPISLSKYTALIEDRAELQAENSRLWSEKIALEKRLAEREG